MQVQILPAARMPRTTEYYTYAVPLELRKKIKIRQIVEINLRSKNVHGLVLKVQKQETAKYKLKKINKILYPEILITKQQIKLIDFMFNYYLSAKSISLKSILPDIPKKYKKIKINRYKNKKQKLILVPEIELIDKVIFELKLDETKVIKIHSKIAKTKFFKDYLEILNGHEKIIIGTKISVLLPFSNLTEIIIYDESNWNHKQSDINPRFDARKIAEWLAKEHKCKLNFINFVKSKKINKINIINLKSERLKGNYSFLSEKLIQEIKNNLTQKNKIFIFHNRKGLTNYVFCERCNYIFKCPECELGLTYYSSDQQLHCHSCDYKVEIAPFCPKCESSKIKFKGQGVEKIKNELTHEFNNTKIEILDKQTKLPKELCYIDILIGTEFAINKIDFSKFNLIAFTNFDQFLHYPDFRASERAFNIFHKILSEARKNNIILQTNDINNFVIQSIMQNKPEIFYKTELENRKIFNYPPFIKLIKLSFQDTKEKIVVYKTKKACLEIRENFSAKNGLTFGGKDIEVLGPFENHPKKIRNKFKYNIILKAPLNFDIKKLLKFIPNDFVIDVDPERI